MGTNLMLFTTRHTEWILNSFDRVFDEDLSGRFPFDGRRWRVCIQRPGDQNTHGRMQWFTGLDDVCSMFNGDFMLFVCIPWLHGIRSFSFDLTGPILVITGERLYAIGSMFFHQMSSNHFPFTVEVVWWAIKSRSNRHAPNINAIGWVKASTK